MNLFIKNIIFTSILSSTLLVHCGHIYRAEINYKTNKLRLFLTENMENKFILSDKIYSLFSTPYLKNAQIYVLREKKHSKKPIGNKIKFIIEAEIDCTLYKPGKKDPGQLALSFFCKENGRITTELSTSKLSDQVTNLIDRLAKNRLNDS